MKIEEIHDCDKCHGKIVSISIDHTRRTHCGYCNEVVDYSKLSNPDYKAFLKRLKEDALDEENVK